MSGKVKEQNINQSLLFALTGIFVLTFAIIVIQSGKQGSDFMCHGTWAVEGMVDDTWGKFRSYPLWHVLVWGFASITTASASYAAGVITALFNTATALLIFKIAEYFLGNSYNQKVLAFIVIVLSFMTGIYVPWVNKNIYLGQNSPNVWHNPTNMAVKPIALAVFILFVWLYMQYGKDNGKPHRKEAISMGVCSILLLVSCTAKPSFVQGFLPAVMVFLLIELVATKGKVFFFCIKAALMFLPSVLLVIYQMTRVFQGGAKGGVSVELLTAMSTFSPNIKWSLVIGIVFPIFVIVLKLRTIFTDKLMWLSLIFYGAALAEALLLIEVSEPYSGNFTWAWQLAMFILFVVTVIRFFQLFADYEVIKIKFKKTIFSVGFIILYLHFFSGIYYYIHLFITHEQC